MHDLPLDHSKRVAITPGLFAKHENAILPAKPHFFHLAVLPDEHGITLRFRISVFPAPFAFRQNLLSLLDSRSISVDHQAVLTCLQIGFADLCRLGDIDGLGERLCEERHRRNQSGRQRHTAENRIEFHACQLPFRRDRVSQISGCRMQNRVLTRVIRASSLTRKTPRSSWTNGRKDYVSSPRGCHRGVFHFIPCFACAALPAALV